MTTLADLSVAEELSCDRYTGGLQSRPGEDLDIGKDKFFKPWLNVKSNFRKDLQRCHQLNSSERNVESVSINRHSDFKSLAHDQRITDGFTYDQGVNPMPYLGQTNHGCLDNRLSISSDDSVIFPSALNKRLFTCPYCRYLTDRKNNLKRHVITMHRKCDRTLECCGLVFNSKASLRDHVIVFHNAGYSCRFCSRNFCRKALLKRHLAVHSGRKDFSCDQCDYATSHKSNLDRHKKIHERVDKITESLSPSSEMQLQRNLSDDVDVIDHKMLANMGTVSDTCTDSSSEIDIGEGGEFQEDTLSSPLKSPTPHVGHLTYSITESFGHFNDDSTKVPTMPPHLNPNIFSTSAFHPLYSHVSTLQRSSGIFYHKSNPSTFHVSSFKRNFNFRETYAHYDFSRSSNPTMLDNNYSTFVHVRNTKINDDVVPKGSGLQAFADFHDCNTTKVDDISTTKTSSADKLPEEDDNNADVQESSSPASPLIFRLVDVISSDWEKRKEILKLRSLKRERNCVS